MEKKISTGHILHYSIGDPVYLITDPDQYERLVVGINLRPGGSVSYTLQMGADECTVHYHFEMSSEPGEARFISDTP